MRKRAGVGGGYYPTMIFLHSGRCRAAYSVYIARYAMCTAHTYGYARDDGTRQAIRQRQKWPRRFKADRRPSRSCSLRTRCSRLRSSITSAPTHPHGQATQLVVASSSRRRPRHFALRRWRRLIQPWAFVSRLCYHCCCCCHLSCLSSVLSPWLPGSAAGACTTHARCRDVSSTPEQR